MLQNAVVGMCGLCEAGVLCAVANGWGLNKGVVLLTTVNINRPNYRLKPYTTEGPTYVRSAQNKVDLVFSTGKFESLVIFLVQESKGTISVSRTRSLVL